MHSTKIGHTQLRCIQPKKEIKVGSLTGRKQSKLENFSDYLIKIPSNDTARIQEAHILVGHILCTLTEEIIFGPIKKK